MAELPGSWYGAMEATIFTEWVYDFLKPNAVDLKVAHPAMLKVITAANQIQIIRQPVDSCQSILKINTSIKSK